MMNGIRRFDDDASCGDVGADIRRPRLRTRYDLEKSKVRFEQLQCALSLSSVDRR